MVDADDEEADDTRYIQGAGEDDEVKNCINSNNISVTFEFENLESESSYTAIYKLGSEFNTATEYILSKGRSNNFVVILQKGEFL